MSTSLAVQVWKLDLDKITAFILMALCDSADDDGSNCYPSTRYLAWKTGCSKSQVYETLHELEQGAIIVKVGMKGETPEYEIHLEKAPTKPPYRKRRPGRPRREPQEKPSTVWNGFQVVETIPQDGNHSTPRKTRPQGGNHFHTVENPSTVWTDERRLEVPPPQEQSGPGDSKRVSDPTYIPILLPELKDPLATPTQKPAHAETQAPEARGSGEFVHASEWAQTRRGKQWMIAHGWPEKTHWKVSVYLTAFREFQREGEAVHAEA